MSPDRKPADPLLDAEAWPLTQPGLYRSEAFPEDLDAERPLEALRTVPVGRRVASLSRALWLGLRFRPG